MYVCILYEPEFVNILFQNSSCPSPTSSRIVDEDWNGKSPELLSFARIEQSCSKFVSVDVERIFSWWFRWFSNRSGNVGGVVVLSFSFIVSSDWYQSDCSVNVGGNCGSNEI